MRSVPDSTTAGREDRTRTLLKALAVVLALAAAYFSLVWLQLERVQNLGAEIEKQANSAALSLSAAIDLLRESPGSASEIAPQLEEIRQDVDETITRVDGLSTNSMPPGVEARRAYGDALSSYVTELDGYRSQISTITALVLARTETVQKISEGFGQLGKLSDPGLTEAGIRATLADVKDVVDESVTELGSISASATPLYSSRALVARLSAVSAVIDEVLGGLAERSQTRLDRAVQSFAQLMQGDWQTLFIQYDMRGLGQVVTSLQGLSERREQVSDARERVVSTQKAVGAVALVCFFGALVSAGFGWRR